MRRTTVALLMLGTAAIAGCSSGGSSAPTTTVQSTVSTIPTSGPAIKIMLIYEKSQGIASPDLPEGAQAAVQAINAAGGVSGRPIALQVCDTNNDPNTATACANKAVSDGAVASVGNISQQSAAYFPVFVQHQIPVIGESPATASAFTSPMSYPTEGGAVSNFAALGRFVAAKGAKTISLIRPDIAAGGAAKTFVDKGLQPLGLSVKNDVAVPLDAPDMTPYVSQALAGGTDGLVVALTGSQATNVIQAAQQSDPNLRIGLVASNLDQVIASLGANVNGVVLADYLIPTSVPTAGTRQFVSEMRKAGFHDVNGTAPLSWLAVHAFASVATGMPTVTGPALIAKLNKTSGLVTGVTPPLQWTQGGVGGIPRVFNACMYGSQLNAKGVQKPISGKFVDPFTGQPCPTPS